MLIRVMLIRVMLTGVVGTKARRTDTDTQSPTRSGGRVSEQSHVERERRFKGRQRQSDRGVEGAEVGVEVEGGGGGNRFFRVQGKDSGDREVTGGGGGGLDTTIPHFHSHSRCCCCGSCCCCCGDCWHRFCSCCCFSQQTVDRGHDQRVYQADGESMHSVVLTHTPHIHTYTPHIYKHTHTRTNSSKRRIRAG